MVALMETSGNTVMGLSLVKVRTVWTTL